MRQPKCVVNSAITGRKMSWPVAELAASMPITRPRRWLNQRVATVAASTIAVRPVPTPTTMPHRTMSCQTRVIVSEARKAVAINAQAAMITRRTPKRFMNAAANGPNNPYNRIRSASAEEICASLQPNSCSSGTISTPGVLIAAAVTSMVRKVTATTTQP